MMDFIKELYGQFGEKYPTYSFFFVALIGAVVGVAISMGCWWSVGKAYERDHAKKPDISTTGRAAHDVATPSDNTQFTSTHSETLNTNSVSYNTKEKSIVSNAPSQNTMGKVINNTGVCAAP